MSGKRCTEDFPKRPRILIVDDEPDALLTFKAFLRSDEFDVETFEAPEPALTRCAECATNGVRFDLAILDIRMPGLDGLQLYQRLKRISKSIKVIFISALDAARDLLRKLSESRDIEIIKKPVNREIFSQRVRYILNKS